MEQIARALGIGSRESICICGCGGKTSLLWGLAEFYNNRKVLVTPTARLGPSKSQPYNSFSSAEQLLGHISGGDIFTNLAPIYGNGVHLLGVPDEDGFHLNAVPPELLQKVAPYFDMVLTEGDGSRMRPLKGWAEYEPVVPDFTTMSVGVLTLWPVGLAMSDEYVHRMEIFCRNSGAKPGGAITLEHIAANISHPDSLISKMRGRKVLLINQVESPREMELARNFVSLLPASVLGQLDRIICASLQQRSADLLYES